MLSLFLDLSSELHHLLSVVFYLLSLFRVQEIIYVKILRKEPKCLRTYYLQYLVASGPSKMASKIDPQSFRNRSQELVHDQHYGSTLQRPAPVHRAA